MIDNQVTSLRPETREILRRVEELTGTPVEVVRDAAQAQLARIARARGGAPAHVLRVNPALGPPDYLVAYQCGFILRLYETPPRERREFGGTAQGRADAERLVRRFGQTAKLPESAMGQLANQLYDGLLTQLRSYPIGLRIDGWIRASFPGLDALQRAAVARQQKDNLGVLRPEIKAIAPKPIYDANASMNAAYAVFCDRVFGKSGYAVPYRSAGYEKRGRRLLDIEETIPEEPSADRLLVDAWAAELGLSGWYQWIELRL